MSAPYFAINGFGRIGRSAFRVWWRYFRDNLTLRAINTSGSMDIGDWVHLMKYDSNYGVFAEDIDFVEHQKAKAATDADPFLGVIMVGQYHIHVLAQKDPAKLPWDTLKVHTVVESTGVFTNAEKAGLHLKGGASCVVLSAPPKDGSIKTYVIGVNHQQLKHEPPAILSNASCTTNCVAPVAYVINENFGIEKATMTTVHAYTDDQNLQDNSHRDLRRARTAGRSIIPTSTGAAIAVTETIPELKEKFDGISMRVPVSVGSISDMVFVTKKKTTVEEVNEALKNASHSARFKGILAVTKEPLVSVDIVGRRESSIVDLNLTQVIEGDLVKVVSWYDNEWGYCNRLLEQVVLACHK